MSRGNEQSLPAGDIQAAPAGQAAPLGEERIPFEQLAATEGYDEIDEQARQWFQGLGALVQGGTQNIEFEEGVSYTEDRALNQTIAFVVHSGGYRISVGLGAPNEQVAQRHRELLLGDLALLSLLDRDPRPQDVPAFGRALWLARRITIATLEAASEEHGRRKEEEERGRDTVTGYFNRLGYDRLYARLVNARGEDDPERGIANLFIDLTNFKKINDVMGHDVGDEALREAADELWVHARLDDNPFLARVGGDEFRMLLGRMLRKSLPGFLRRVRRFQDAKVALDPITGVSRSQAMWNKIETFSNPKRQGARVVMEDVVEPLPPNAPADAKPVTRKVRMLYIGLGRQEQRIGPLADITVLAIGAAIHNDEQDVQVVVAPDTPEDAADTTVDVKAEIQARAARTEEEMKRVEGDSELDAERHKKRLHAKMGGKYRP